MPATLAIGIVSVVFIIAVKVRVPLGVAFLGSAVLMCILSGMPVLDIPGAVFESLIAYETLRLVGIVYLLTLMGMTLAELGVLSKTVEALQILVSDKRVSMVIPASLIGLLPMPGGAMLSAPMVEEGSKKFDITRERLTFLNFWFRHLWEYVWPLYPGIILSSAILEMPVARLIGSMWPLTLCMIFFGVIYSFPGMEPLNTSSNKNGDWFSALGAFIKLTWYVWVVVVFVFGFGIDIFPVVAVCVLTMLLFVRGASREKLGLLKKGFSWRILTLVAGVMIFKGVVESSGVLGGLAVELSGIPPTLLLFAIPFFVGFLTGVNSAYVGLAFPVLLPILLKGGFDPGNFALAYASGFTGVLTSPLHLCLLLTKEFYSAKWGGIYRYLAPASISVLAIAVIIFILR
ncbi:hypothetical protein DRQ36_02465 [bacterium]|nr:MAG: hypothetical protein DRQ36_02465 [bacterium]